LLVRALALLSAYDPGMSQNDSQFWYDLLIPRNLKSLFNFCGTLSQSLPKGPGSAPTIFGFPPRVDSSYKKNLFKYTLQIFFTIWLGIICYYFWQPGVKGCLEVPARVQTIDPKIYMLWHCATANLFIYLIFNFKLLL